MTPSKKHRKLHAAVFKAPAHSHSKSYESEHLSEDAQQLATWALEGGEATHGVLVFLSQRPSLVAPFIQAVTARLHAAIPTCQYLIVRLTMDVAALAFANNAAYPPANDPWLQVLDELTTVLFLHLSFCGIGTDAYHQLLLVIQKLFLPNLAAHPWLAPILDKICGWISVNYLLSITLLLDLPKIATELPIVLPKELRRLEQSMVRDICIQYPPAVVTCLRATCGLARLHIKGFKGSYSPHAEFDYVARVFELPLGLANGIADDDDSRAAAHLTSVGNNILASWLVSRLHHNHSYNNNNNSDSYNHTAVPSNGSSTTAHTQQSNNNNKLKDKRDTSERKHGICRIGMVPLAMRDLWLELALSQYGSAREALQSKGILEEEMEMGGSLLRLVLCKSLLTMQDPFAYLKHNSTCTTTATTTPNPTVATISLNKEIVLRELLYLYNVQPLDKSQYWSDIPFMRFIKLVMTGEGRKGEDNDEQEDVNNMCLPWLPSSWFSELPHGVCETESEQPMAWLVVKATLQLEQGHRDAAESNENGTQHVPKIVKQCIHGKNPWLYAQIFMEFTQWRLYVLTTFNIQLHGQDKNISSQDALQSIQRFMLYLGEEGSDDVMVMVVDNKQRLDRVNQYMALFDKGNVTVHDTDTHKRPAEDHDYALDGPMGVSVSKREKISDKISQEANAMAVAMIPRNLRGLSPNNREQLEKEVHEALGGWACMERRAPAQFAQAISILINTQYPCENHRLLDHVLATFNLSSIEHARLVGRSMAQLVQKGTRAFRKHPPFYAILSRFNRRSTSHPAICHAFLDVFLTANTHFRLSPFIVDSLLSADVGFRLEFLRKLVHCSYKECTGQPVEVEVDLDTDTTTHKGEKEKDRARVQWTEQLISLLQEEERHRSSGRFRDTVVPLLIQEELRGQPLTSLVGSAIKRLAGSIKAYFYQPFSSDVQTTVEYLFCPPSHRCNTVRMCAVMNVILEVLTNTYLGEGKGEGDGAEGGGGGGGGPINSNSNSNSTCPSQSNTRQIDVQQQQPNESLILAMKALQATEMPQNTRWYRNYFLPCALHSIGAIPQASHLLRLTLSQPSLYTVLYPVGPSQSYGLRHLILSIQQTCSDAEQQQIVQLWEQCWYKQVTVGWEWMRTLLDAFTDCHAILSSMVSRLFDHYITRLFYTALELENFDAFSISLVAIIDYLFGLVKDTTLFSPIVHRFCHEVAVLPSGDTRRQWCVRCIRRAVRGLLRRAGNMSTLPVSLDGGAIDRATVRAGVGMLLNLLTSARQDDSELWKMLVELFDMVTFEAVICNISPTMDPGVVAGLLDIILSLLSLSSLHPGAVIPSAPMQALKVDVDGPGPSPINNIHFWTQPRITVMIRTLLLTETPEVQPRLEALLGHLIRSDATIAQNMVNSIGSQMQANPKSCPHLSRGVSLLELALLYHPSILTTLLAIIRSLLFVPMVTAHQPSSVSPIDATSNAWVAASQQPPLALTTRLYAPSGLALHLLTRTYLHVAACMDTANENLDQSGIYNQSMMRQVENVVQEALEGMGWQGLEVAASQLELAHSCLRHPVLRANILKDHLGSLVAATGSKSQGTRDLAAAILCQLRSMGDLGKPELAREFYMQLSVKSSLGAVFMRRSMSLLGLNSINNTDVDHVVY